MYALTDEQRDFQARARDLAETVIAPRAAEVDRSEEYPWDNVAALREAGFVGMTIPEEFGGQGRSFLDAVILIVEMAKVCGVTGRIAVECNMGAISAVMKYGNDEQRKLAADVVLSGDKPAICITEPDAGSAASEMTTRAEKKGDNWILNGKKHWITGGGVSRLHLIFARVFENGFEQGIGGFLAVRDPDAGTPKGLIIGNREPTMGLRGIPECEIIFEDLEVPSAMMIIPPEGLRRGFAGLMNAYNAQRVGAAAVALGLAEGAYEKALAYSHEREQFGRPIREFQGLQWMLADMSVQIAAAEALCYKAAGNAGDGFPDANEAAQAKIFTSEMAIKVTNDALQVFGAAGYSRNNPMERIARDARMFTIGGGTAQILRTVVASRILKTKLPQTRDGYMNLPGAGTGE
ncbi:MAG: acyl-CoA dehydrogenase [Rhodospirillaceae bacterium]|nr:acyl-CoA dehydrogenase [Rhodospirillaceae bacterium]HAA93734.1 acyl-CoA dehydrogenase [Rhodospirillaceae bacterium]